MAFLYNYVRRSLDIQSLNWTNLKYLVTGEFHFRQVDMLFYFQDRKSTITGMASCSCLVFFTFSRGIWFIISVNYFIQNFIQTTNSLL